MTLKKSCIHGFAEDVYCRYCSPPSENPFLDDPKPLSDHLFDETPAQRLLRKADDLTDDAARIMRQKNHDYTSGSGDPFANFRMAGSLGVHPAVGICIRTGDKLQRIRTFAERGELKVDNEGLRDACVDVINYAILVYAMLTEDEQ